ncbi:MAG: sodium/substrate symporter small subunit [Oxalobacteraceae bacterium]
MKQSAQRAIHWRATRRLTTVLLLTWLSITFGGIFFARELSDPTMFGWPVSFYLIAQGIPLIYLLILGIYAWRMRALDRRYRKEG